MQVTQKIPSVFAGLGDPVESGLVTNLARPSGKVANEPVGREQVAIGPVEQGNRPMAGERRDRSLAVGP